MGTFGKYEVLEKIGEGGFGEVFKGRDPNLKRLVAIKVCKTTSRELRERFFREAEITARLRHPNITIVHDFGDRDGTPYLVQELLDGDDLSALLDRGDPSGRLARIEILRQIAAGLSHAHDHGVVHRDLKPQNIRVLADGHVKIMDFGIAKLVSAEHALTESGVTLGTASYMAPEQVRGQPIDRRADVFSYGVLAYELMTGRRPFEGESVSTICYRIVHEEPRRMRSLWLECPPILEALVEKCLCKDREHRWAGFRELLVELDKVAEPWRLTDVAGSRPADVLVGPTRALLAAGDLTAPSEPPLEHAAPRRPLHRESPSVLATTRSAPPATASSDRSSFFRTALRGGRHRSAVVALLLGVLLLGMVSVGWWYVDRASKAAIAADAARARVEADAQRLVDAERERTAEAKLRATAELASERSRLEREKQQAVAAEQERALVEQQQRDDDALKAQLAADQRERKEKERLAQAAKEQQERDEKERLAQATKEQQALDENVASLARADVPAAPPFAPPTDAVRDETGLAWTVLEAGTGGEGPGRADYAAVRYTGRTADGTVFDTTAGKPVLVPLGTALEGFARGVGMMSPGERRRIWIPEALAFGGREGKPKGPLVFDISLVAVLRVPPVPPDVAAPPADAGVGKGGLASKVLRAGTGTAHPKKRSTVEVHYNAWTTDGKLFDSSRIRGEPTTFPLDAVIRGWAEGIPLMVEGEVRRFWIPEKLAFKGEAGKPAGMLVYDIELLRIVD